MYDQIAKTISYYVYLSIMPPCGKRDKINTKIKIKANKVVLAQIQWYFWGKQSYLGKMWLCFWQIQVNLRKIQIYLGQIQLHLQLIQSYLWQILANLEFGNN